jgi:hypothetical protein
MDRPDQPPQGPSPDHASSGGSNPLARLTSISGHGLTRGSENGTKPNVPPPAAPSISAAPAIAVPASMPTVGRLKEGTAAQLWPSDALFAAWLVGNLDALVDATSLRVTGPQLLEGTTSVVMGTLSDGKPVVVVPQRGASTDDAFGALVRHVGASAAEHGVWICGEPASEHAAAVSWLNRAIDGLFLMVRVGAVTIGDSIAAPTFTMAVRSPRGDDPGVESTAPLTDRAASDTRRADDWLSEMREEAAKP